MNINGDIIPSSIKSAVETLVSAMDEQDKRAIRAASDGTVFHHTLGTGMRNAWSFWEADSPLKRDAVASYGIAHADDISGLIIAWTCAEVRGESFDPVAHCQKFHEHWAMYGTDALAAGGWPPTGEEGKSFDG